MRTRLIPPDVRRAFAAVAITAAPAFAQQPAAPQPAGPRTIVGIVRDTIGNPVDSVELLIASMKRHAMSGPDGAFRFDDVKPGSYQILARKLGFYPQVQTTTVDDKGGVVSFSITQGIRALPPVVTSVARGGLSGVIGDTSYNVVEGAQVAVIGGAGRARSDSLGRFFLDLGPGKYMVNVTRPGYASRLVSVTIPSDSGRRMTVWLTPANRGQNARAVFAYDALGLRLEQRNPVFSTIFTREDINRLGIEDGSQLARLGANSQFGPPDDRCEAIVDGGPLTLPLWAIDAADIEAMETYAPKPNRGTVTSIGGSRGNSNRSSSSSNAQAQTPCKGVRVYVWLRK
jgi:hypothetical protein